VTAAPIWKRSSSTWRATPAYGRRRNERAGADAIPSRGAGHPLPPRVFVGARLRHGAALLVPAALVVAARARSHLLADRADVHVGLLADVCRPTGRRRCACRSDFPRRGDAVGHAVPRPARVLDLDPRGDVLAQLVEPADLAVAADGVRYLADDHECHQACGRHGAGIDPRHPVLWLQSVGARLRAGGVLRQPDAHRLGRRDLRVGPTAAKRARRREHGLVDHVPAVAAHLRLLPGQRAARLAADDRLVPAADLRVRGHARPAARPRLPRRPNAAGARHQYGAVYAGDFGLPGVPEELPPAWFPARRRRITRDPVPHTGVTR